MFSPASHNSDTKMWWYKYDSWEDAKDCKKCVYVFLRNNRDVYVGKAKNFGIRYAKGYRYLVNAMLQNGAELWILELGRCWNRVSDIENTLIHSQKRNAL